jgi:lipopolysaccharide export system ATP-binding protein
MTSFRLDGILAARHIAKFREGRPVVEDVSLYVRRGEVVGLLGPGGAGKSTVFAMLAGIMAPDHGRIMLDKTDLTRMPMFERARRGISYLPQQPSVFRGLTVEQNILLVLEAHEPKAKVRREMLNFLLNELGIDRIRNVPAARLSGGERRRCEIARALASSPSFILLDEPFAGIDPIAVKDIRLLARMITREGVGVLITDHNVREALGLIDRAYIMASGRVFVHGTPAVIVADPAVRRVYLGADFSV